MKGAGNAPNNNKRTIVHLPEKVVIKGLKKRERWPAKVLQYEKAQDKVTCANRGSKDTLTNVTSSELAGMNAGVHQEDMPWSQGKQRTVIPGNRNEATLQVHLGKMRLRVHVGLPTSCWEN